MTTTPSIALQAIRLYKANRYAVENFGLAATFGDDRPARRLYRKGRELTAAGLVAQEA